MPLVKAGRWDGYINLFQIKTGKFFNGLLLDLAQWCKKNHKTFEIRDAKNIIPDLGFTDEWLDHWEEYGVMEPMEHQREYIKSILKGCYCMCLSPTSSGKSYIVYMCVRYLLEKFPEMKILISVPSSLLREQLFLDFESYAVDWNTEENCMTIAGGMNPKIEKSVVISTWQTLHKFSPGWFKQFDAYFCDEAHLADSKCISKIVESMAHAKLRIGLTGTLDGTKLHELEMKARFGPIIKKTSTIDLMEKGIVADLSIKCIQLHYPEEDCYMVSHLRYAEEIDFVVRHEERNKYIIDLANSLKGNVLVLFNFIEKQGKVLERIGRDAEKNGGKKIRYMDGATKVDERMKIKEEMEDVSDIITIASSSMISTGTSIKNIEHIIFAHPYKTRIRNIQSIGRGLRIRPGKTKATLFDICDDLRYSGRKKQKENYLYKHWVLRLETYQSEGFDYEIEERCIGKDSKELHR